MFTKFFKKDGPKKEPPIRQESSPTFRETVFNLSDMQKMEAKFNKYAEAARKSSTELSPHDLNCTDRYGFKHKSSISKEISRRESKQYTLEVNRNEKWLKMLYHWKKYQGTTKLTDRVYKGIPESIRGYVWCLMLDVPAIISKNHGVYKDMKSKILSEAKPPVIMLIHQDIKRTFRNNCVYNEPYSIKQQQLLYVLATYSIVNVKLGYIQGMSEMAARFLMYMSEEEAFWAFTNFVSGNKHSMHGFLARSFPKLHRFQTHHNTVLKKMLPKVYKNLVNLEYANLYSIKWFMLAFIRLPLTLSLRVWDVLLLKGEEVLTGMSYTIVKLLQNELLQKDPESIFIFLQNMEKNPSLQAEHDEHIMRLLKSNIAALTRHKLQIPPPPSNYIERYKLEVVKKP